MQRRRNARLSRQTAGVSKAKDLPGFRGEETLENLINYIDAPAQASRKSKKKKKKISTADSADAGAEKLANSCEVFVGTSGVSSDEPSVRVGDSCCIELRKKSDCDSLPDTTSAAVDTNVYSPDEGACFDSSIADNSVPVASAEDSVDPDVVNSEKAPTDLLNDRLAEDLPEVVYTEVKNAALEEENVPGSLTESVTNTVVGDETLAVNCEISSGNSNGHQTADDVELTSVESGKAENMTDSVSSRTDENITENVVESFAAVSDGQNDLDSFLPSLIGSDSVTSDTGSVEDLFVTVQKKKRSKNAAVVAEDPRQRFGRRSSIKGVEDRETSCYAKRSWVKSSDTTSIVPSVSVSRSSIVYSKPSCPVTQRSGVAAAKYSQASNPDTILSSAVTSKPLYKSSSSSLLVEAEHDGTAEQNSRCESAVIYSTSSSNRNTNDVMHVSTDSEKSAFESDSVKPFNRSLPVDGIVATHWQASGPSTLVFECSKKTDSSTSSDVPIGTDGDELTQASNDVDDKLNECADIQIDIMASNPPNISSQPGEDQSVDIQSSEGKKSSQPPVQITSSSDVFLDTRNIAGTTPPRSDISFGFDPGSSPESSSDVSVGHVNPPGGAFTAVAASCHCPVVAPLPPPAAGCAPILYFYPAMPVTILPPVATYTTGRCTPIGVVPPMPAVAGVTNISVAPPAWQPSEDKCISVPVEQDEQNVVVNDDSPASDVTTPSTANKATNEFVLYAAQRYLYSGMLSSCLLFC